MNTGSVSQLARRKNKWAKSAWPRVTWIAYFFSSCFNVRKSGGLLALVILSIKRNGVQNILSMLQHYLCSLRGQTHGPVAVQRQKLNYIRNAARNPDGRRT